ncbi:hypothetical protein GCM10010277_76930 [Streptomyces longisporoflavus]|uniref:hypothetical protein n=1 Tax=Streptomyces longisporoflavus TaxID=28044 RepID=UPI00167DA824|nr:hypothetical protein [Streptomyces longisporoflavus]GGV67984.1 hypothetical protein GCM10010277_76930 [Streptomyces longisporoflavus]
MIPLKPAVYEVTGDEFAAELPVPVPLDVTSHAPGVQFAALSRIQERAGIRFVHSTGSERISNTRWRTCDYTYQAYRAAFGR